MSYHFLNSFTNRLASAIVKELGSAACPNQDGDFVIAVCMRPNDHLVATLLAIWKTGAAYLPLDVTFPLNRIDHIVKESKPVLVLFDDDCKFDTQPAIVSRRALTAINRSSSLTNSAAVALQCTPCFSLPLLAIPITCPFHYSYRRGGFR